MGQIILCVKLYQKQYLYFNTVKYKGKFQCCNLYILFLADNRLTHLDFARDLLTSAVTWIILQKGTFLDILLFSCLNCFVSFPHFVGPFAICDIKYKNKHLTSEISQPEPLVEKRRLCLIALRQRKLYSFKLCGGHEFV